MATSLTGPSGDLEGVAHRPAAAAAAADQGQADRVVLGGMHLRDGDSRQRGRGHRLPAPLQNVAT